MGIKYVFLGDHQIINFFIIYVSYLLTFFLIMIIVIICIVFNHFVFASYIVCIVMYFYLLLPCQNIISTIKILVGHWKAFKWSPIEPVEIKIKIDIIMVVREFII